MNELNLGFMYSFLGLMTSLLGVSIKKKENKSHQVNYNIHINLLGEQYGNFLRKVV
jgi:hypothetical protein